MYCQECGQTARGKFCRHCGARLDESQAAPLENVRIVDAGRSGPPVGHAASVVVAEAVRSNHAECVVAERVGVGLVAANVVREGGRVAEVAGTAWDDECDYRALTARCEVRDLVARCAKQAPERLSGEEFLALADQLVPQPVSMEKLARLMQPLTARWGIRTGQQQSARIDAPIGRVLVRALCSLARQGQTLEEVEQAPEGCTLTAELPSDLWSFAGRLHVGLQRAGRQTLANVQTRIDGQLFDWGKSRRAIERLLAELQRDLA